MAFSAQRGRSESAHSGPDRCAGEFESGQRCSQPTCRILHWFHIAMRFEAAETSALGCGVICPLEREAVQREIPRRQVARLARQARQGRGAHRGPGCVASQATGLRVLEVVGDDSLQRQVLFGLAGQYKQRFQQESVLSTATTVRACF
jgi:hypothetical protein